MASTGEDFVGTRKILGWRDDLEKHLPESLVKVSKERDDSYLTISKDYSLEWNDKEGALCTVTSLVFIREGLSGGKEILIEGQDPIPLPNGARVEFTTDQDPEKLLVSLTGGIVDGEQGTITLEAHPRRGEERPDLRKSPGCLLWPWRLNGRRS